jgi:hypothetical protein
MAVVLAVLPRPMATNALTRSVASTVVVRQLVEPFANPVSKWRDPPVLPKLGLVAPPCVSASSRQLTAGPSGAKRDRSRGPRHCPSRRDNTPRGSANVLDRGDAGAYRPDLLCDAYCFDPKSDGAGADCGEGDAGGTNTRRRRSRRDVRSRTERLSAVECRSERPAAPNLLPRHRPVSRWTAGSKAVTRAGGWTDSAWQMAFCSSVSGVVWVTVPAGPANVT